MKAALFTSFPARFLEQKIYPALKRRGVEVVLTCETRRVESYDLGSMGLDVVLHMNEMGGHSFSEKLSKACRDAGLTVRALSRKTSSWDFLPAPSSPELDEEEEPMDELEAERKGAPSRASEHLEKENSRLKNGNDDLKRANEELRAENKKLRDELVAVQARAAKEFEQGRIDLECFDRFKKEAESRDSVFAAARVLFDSRHLTADEIVQKFFLPRGAEAGKRS